MSLEASSLEERGWCNYVTVWLRLLLLLYDIMLCNVCMMQYYVMDDDVIVSLMLWKDELSYIMMI